MQKIQPINLKLSVTIITLNEEKNITRCLNSVRDIAQEIIVVDSGSTDQTLTLAQQGGATTYTQPWLGFGAQKNFAHSKATQDWVLNLDADEELSPKLREEIRQTLSRTDVELDKISGFSLPRLSYYLGRWIRHGGWYPNRLVRLSRRQKSRWTEPEVHEALRVEGQTEKLHADLFHYPFANMGEQIQTNIRFSSLGTRQLLKNGARPTLSNFTLMLLKPIGKFIETYLLKKGFLDGLAGFIISVHASHSIFMKYANLFDPEFK